MARWPNILLVMCLVSACSGGKRNQWDDVDYSRVYKAYETRENDSSYTQPSITGCVDDDLYNCK